MQYMQELGERKPSPAHDRYRGLADDAYKQGGQVIRKALDTFEAVHSVEDMKKVNKALKAVGMPSLANMIEGGVTRFLKAAELLLAFANLVCADARNRADRPPPPEFHAVPPADRRDRRAPRIQHREDREP